MFNFLRKLMGGTDVEALIEQGAKIIDVRSVGEFNGGHVKGSTNIPLDKINKNLAKIKKMDAPIVTCCASGMRSGSAATILRSNGIDAHNGGSWTSLKKYGK